MNNTITLSEAVALLKAAGIDDPVYEARALFSHFEDIPTYKLVGSDYKSNNPELYSAVYRRAKREPLQYIFGECGFWRETYKVTDAVLIPREDTEVLVDYAVSQLHPGAEILDLCTGSGCIAISTVASVEGASALGIDLSEKAVEIAKENAILNKVEGRVEFLCADALSYSPPSGKKYDAILSNPPYVKNSVYSTLAPEIMYEPRAAFLGGADGCDFYRQLTERYLPHLSEDGFIGYEIGYDQESALIEIAKMNNCDHRIITDLSGNPRVAILKPKKV